MSGKQEIVAGLTNIFGRWQVLLANLGEEQVLEPLLPSTWTVKDVVAHMWSWQQASVARMRAALADAEPDYPEWWSIMGPDPNEDVDRTNAWLYAASRDKPWQQVYADWKAQFEKYLELTREIQEEDLLELGRYPWMNTFALSASAMASLEHHEEHYEELTAWLSAHGRGDFSK